MLRTQRVQSRAMRGFTLVELLIVVAIIGILAAVAIPKFIDATTTAKTGALQGVAGAIASASATNYAMRKAGQAGTVAISACSNAAFASIVTIPSDMTVSAGTTAPGDGTIGDCNINYTTGGIATPVNFKVVGAS